MEVHGGVSDGVSDGVPVPVAIAACTAMTIFYVTILYSPTFILRLPPPSSFKSFMIRRFICAGISTVVSLIVGAFILPIKSWEVSYFLSAYGIRLHHTWEAVVLPLLLTSLMYVGSFVLKILSLWSEGDDRIDLSFDGLKLILQTFNNWMLSLVDNISAWRMYIVAPLTEELVFRACMIPLLLCGGFKPYTVILLSPVFFSLAHLNHLFEFYMQQDSGFLRAAMVVGFQLGYTMIFGSYASFLFVRTGHIAAPLVSHMFCNFMGLPVFFSRKTGMVSVAFMAGAICTTIEPMTVNAGIDTVIGLIDLRWLESLQPLRFFGRKSTTAVPKRSIRSKEMDMESKMKIDMLPAGSVDRDDGPWLELGGPQGSS